MATIEQLSFLKAVKVSDTNTINKFIENNGNIFVDDHFALFAAVEADNDSLIDLFLSLKLDPCAANFRAILAAIKQGNLERVIKLEAHAPDNAFLTPALITALEGKNEKILEHYLTATNRNALSALEPALFEALFACNNIAAKTWLSLNKDLLDCKTLSRYFKIACGEDNDILTQALFDAGFPIEYMDYKALPLAISLGSDKVIAQLIKMNTKANSGDFDPVDIAVHYNNLTALKLLHKHKFAFNNIAKLFYIASSLSQLETVRWLHSTFKDKVFEGNPPVDFKIFKAYEKSPAKMIREMEQVDSFLMPYALAYFFSRTAMTPETYKTRCPSWQVGYINTFIESYSENVA